MKATDLIDQDSLRPDLPDFAAGDEVEVHVRVKEGNRERVQVFHGNVIARSGSGLRWTESSDGLAGSVIVAPSILSRARQRSRRTPRARS